MTSRYLARENLDEHASFVDAIQTLHRKQSGRVSVKKANLARAKATLISFLERVCTELEDPSTKKLSIGCSKQALISSLEPSNNLNEPFTANVAIDSIRQLLNRVSSEIELSAVDIETLDTLAAFSAHQIALELQHSSKSYAQQQDPVRAPDSKQPAADVDR